MQNKVLKKQYQIVRTLGEGGFGAAFLAEDLRTGRACVVKASTYHDAEHREQFEKEARILASLAHPNLPRVYDYFFDSGYPYLVMEFIEGLTLDQLAEDRLEPFEVDDVLAWARDLLDALEYLHGQQPPVIHRDIKPPNVCITPAGKAVLLDFGIARQLDGKGTRGVARSYTWNYSPLEQQLAYEPEGSAGRTGPYSDIYSLGATLYFALTLIDPPNACLRLANDELRPIREINSAVSPALAAALNQALAIEPQKRCQAAPELRRLLFGADNIKNPKGDTKEMYTAEISRGNPTCFLFLIDQSYSMAEPLGGETGGESKAKLCADALNRLLQTIVGRCTKNDGVRRYFQVGVIGYGANIGPAFDGALAGQEMAWIDEIAEHARLEERQRKVSDGAGGLVEVPYTLPIWFEPVANGGTPMVRAFWQAHTLLEAWTVDHPTAFPPVVINITDGEATDGDPLPASEAIRELATEDGNVLVLNLHLSSRSSRSFQFPDSESELPDQYACLLFKMSSCLTPNMRAMAREMGYKASEDARGFVFNADMEDVVQFLTIGTMAANR